VHSDLNRFIEAQNPIYDDVVAELEAGEKRSHWMWFVFPQIAGLGTSTTAQRYSISSLDEARQYLAHPVLGPRLEECCRALLGLEHHVTARDVLGSIDAMKLQSSMTLFAHAATNNPVFERVLDRLCGGAWDTRTEALLSSPGTSPSP
jgi:uncharacterized protein (DUF1810 family)